MKKLGLKNHLGPKTRDPQKFASKKILGPKKRCVPKKFRSKKNFGPLKYVSQRIRVQKIIRSLKNLALKKLVPKTILVPKKFCPQKNLGPIKIWIPKKFGFQKSLINLESRNCLGLKKFWVLKILG